MQTHCPPLKSFIIARVMKHMPASLPRNWIVFRLGRLGDVALCTGALEALARDFNLRFKVVTRDVLAPLFDHSPCVDEVIPVKEEDLTLAGFAAFASRLRSDHGDCAFLDLHGSLRSRLLAAFWPGQVRRYRKMSLERRLFLRCRSAGLSAALGRHNVPQRYYAALAAPRPAGELLPRVRLTAVETEAAAGCLGRLFPGGQPPVALHPFAAHPMKSWSAARWRELAALLEARGLPWICLGAGSEPSPFAGDERDLYNRLSLRESCALLSLCRALVSGDSGPMHLAGAVGTPVMALFGPTTREWGFFPAGARDHIFELPLDCRPCSLHGKDSCSLKGRCLDALPPLAIINAVLDLDPCNKPLEY